VSSALDHFTGRDPGKACTTIASDQGASELRHTGTPRPTLLTSDAEE
jgi:hypothetical protein